MKKIIRPFFAPQLFIPHQTKSIDFYLYGLGAVIRRQWLNEDGTIHVAELSFDGAIFHVHENNEGKGQLNPHGVGATTVMVGLFVPDVDALMRKAIAAGAQQVEAPQDYDYGYRQGIIRDPFGHLWLIEKEI